jgi:predicted nucleotidyltransferase component of viral defense system
MLHTKTVTAETYALLKYIQAQKAFNEMRLVGGTSLALQYGHRESEDLDFFGKSGLDMGELMEILKNQGEIKQIKNSSTIKVLSVNNTKIDFVEYSYPWIAKPVLVDGLTLAAVQDIAAMKIAAITGRGSRKDFYDLDLLLTLFSLEEILNFYTKKFSDGSLYLALKSLIYFEDAEHEKDPVLLRKRAWNEVKANIEKMHLDYMKNQKS